MYQMISFKYISIGTRVFGLGKGWGRIYHIEGRRSFPITVKFFNGQMEFYTWGGYAVAEGIRALFWHYEIKTD